MIDIKSLYWAAGFLEGEGTFHAHERTYTRYLRYGQPKIRKWAEFSVTAVQVQREPLERLQALFGGVIYSRKTYSLKHSPSFRWETRAARARGIMITLYSILSPKRQEQVDKALSLNWGGVYLAQSRLRLPQRDMSFQSEPAHLEKASAATKQYWARVKAGELPMRRKAIRSKAQLGGGFIQ